MRSGHCLHEPVEQVHAQLDVGPRDRRPRVGVVRQEAGADPERGGGLRGRPVGWVPAVERALVGLVRLREPQRHVQGERELEQHERDLLALARAARGGAAARGSARSPRRGAYSWRARSPARVRYTAARSSSSAPSQWWASRPATSSSRPAYCRLEPLGGLAVQAVPVLAHEGPVGRVLDQRVLEPELGLGPPAALAHEVQPLQLGERRAHLLRLRSATPSSSGRPNCRPSTDAAIRASCVAALEPVDAGEDHLLDGGRDLHGHLVVEPPAALPVVDERAGVGERPDDLLQEERVALGRLEDPPLGVGAAACPAPTSACSSSRPASPDSASRASSATRCGSARPTSSFSRHAPWSRSGREVSTSRSASVSVSAASRCRSCSEVASAQCRSSIANATGPSAASRAVRRAHHLERPVLQRLGRQLREAGRDVGLQGRDRAARRGTGRCRRAPSPNSSSTCRRSATRTRSSGSSARTPEPRAQQVAQRPVGHRLAVARRSGPRATGAGRAPVTPLEGRAQLREQPGLADAGLAGEEDDAAAAGEGSLDGGLAGGELALAADHRRLTPSNPRARDGVAETPRTSTAANGLGLALERSCTGSAHVERRTRPAAACRRRPARSRAGRPPADARRCSPRRRAPRTRPGCPRRRRRRRRARC